MSDNTQPCWGYSKDDAKIFDLAEGEALPAGYYKSPVSVPGSEAEARYKADAEREGAPMPLVTEAPPAAPAKADKAGDKADADTKAGK